MIRVAMFIDIGAFLCDLCLPDSWSWFCSDPTQPSSPDCCHWEPQWTGYHTRGWSSSEFWHGSKAVACSIIILIIVNNDFTEIFTMHCRLRQEQFYGDICCVMHIYRLGMIHSKKLEVDLTQNGLPQLQDLYHLLLLPQCRVTCSLCVIKVPIWYEYLYKT